MNIFNVEEIHIFNVLLFRHMSKHLLQNLYYERYFTISLGHLLRKDLYLNRSNSVEHSIVRHVLPGFTSHSPAAVTYQLLFNREYFTLIQQRCVIYYPKFVHLVVLIQPKNLCFTHSWLLSQPYVILIVVCATKLAFKFLFQSNQPYSIFI